MPDPTRAVCRIAILGGGITGLTALDVLLRPEQNGAPVEPFLLEAAERVGGLIRTERIQDFLVEAGPDSFLTEKPEGIALAKDLGLDRELIGSNDGERRTYVLHHGRLVPLPADWQLFVPGSLTSGLTTPLLPISARFEVLGEFLRSGRLRKSHPADEPAAEFVRRHFGNGMLENVAEPLLAGIYGGKPEQLSARSALPRFFSVEQQYGSLTRGVARSNRKRRTGGPTFTTLRGGMEQLVQHLVAKGGNCPSSHIQLGVRATIIEPSQTGAGDGPQSLGSRYTIRGETGAHFEADAVILALPAFECAKLLRTMHAGLAHDLESIPYTPAVLVALGYSVQPAHLPAGFGFLIPRASGQRLVACTFVHRKFPSRAPERGALLRCFLGGARDPEILQMNDEELTSLAVEEIGDLLGLRAAPAFTRVYRWPLAMPQYVVGHEERIRKIRAAVEGLPGIFLAGNAYSGVGISDCVRTAKAAAESAVAFSLAGTK